MSELVLDRIDKAKTALLQVRSAQEARKVIAMADAARVYAKEVGASSELVNFAGEIRLRAERRLGEVLQEQPKAPPGPSRQIGSRRGPIRAKPPTLAESGLTKKQSSRAQMLAAVPERKFEEKLAKAKAEGELVPSKVAAEICKDKREELRSKREHQVREKAKAHPVGECPDKFSLLYADPPWKYDFSATESRRIENQYPTMEIEEIERLAVSDIAAKDAVLFLWATSPKIREALRVMAAWGFEYKTMIVWDKMRIGMGYYARQRHELLLIGTRGNPGVPKPSDRPESIIAIKRGEHSAKPEEFYGLLERMFPLLTARVELFARKTREGWHSWGPEAK